MKTVCKGKILSNGVCDTCYQLSQSSSGDCGRLIDLSQGEQPAQPVDKQEQNIWISWLKKRIELTDHQWDLVRFALSELQNEIHQLKSLSPSPERGESDDKIYKDDQEQVQEIHDALFPEKNTNLT